MIGQVTDRIKRLTCRTCGDERMGTSQRPLPRSLQLGLDGGNNGGHVRQAAGTEFTTGHGTFIRLHDRNAVRAQLGDIADRRGMLPHPHVHGGRHEDRLVGRQQHGRGEIIRETGIRLGHQIGRCRADDNKIGRARQLDVAHLGFVIEIEQLGIGLFARQG